MKIDNNSPLINANTLSSTRPATGDIPSSTPLQANNTQPESITLRSGQMTSDVIDATIDLPDQKLFRGDHSYYLLAPDERRDQLFARLNEDQQKVVLDSHLPADQTFFDLAEKLSDEELGQLINSLDKLQTRPSRSNPDMPIVVNHSAGIAKDFIDTLSSMDDATMKRAVTEASQHADKAVSTPATDIYNARGFVTLSEGSSSANDLHNFVIAINTTDDATQMLDKLAGFEDSQQSLLFGALAADQQTGTTLMDSLAERDSATRDAVLNYLSPRIETWHFATKHILSLSIDNSGSWARTPEQGITSKDNSIDIINRSMDLLTNYKMDDEQLADSFNTLNNMDLADQRTWLAITHTGLETLAGSGSKEAPVDLTDQQRVLDTLDELRNSSSVREAVSFSTLGDKSTVLSAYEIKEYGKGQHDQQEMIKLLATDAWLNPDDTGQLADKLNQLGGEARDELIADLNQLNKLDSPLSEKTDSELKQALQPLQNRTSSIKNTDDVKALLQAETNTPVEQKEDFWTATELAGNHVDELIQELQNSSDTIRAQIIDNLTNESVKVTKGDQTRDDARQHLNELLNNLSNATDDRDKQRFLDNR